VILTKPYAIKFVENLRCLKGNLTSYAQIFQLLLVLIASFSSVNLQGQLTESVFREKKLFIDAEVTPLDTLSIVPESFLILILNQPLDSSLYELNPAEASLIWKGEFPNDSVQISYRVFQLKLDEEFYHKDPSMILPDKSLGVNPFEYAYEAGQEDDFFQMSGLNRSGSISRGVAFGNNQDLAVNSSLNLELSGQLNDEVSIMASITDNNIPIQPDGNTQQLQDFDQVFIQVYNQKSKLTAGDLQLRKPEGYFMTFFKRAQGGSFESTFFADDMNKDKGVFNTRVSGAISKGKFARNVVQGSEGNQGPYRLRGAENEPFIIVLAGTEMVYIDGELMKRGQEYDYTIDYNTAEITFTPRHLITKDRRITVEFQYSDQNYVRSLAEGNLEYKKDKLQLYFNFFSEQDAKNQPLQLNIGEEDRLFLSSIGDDLDRAIIPSFREAEFTDNQVLYEMRDSLGYDSIFVYSTDMNAQLYRLTFSDVGNGNGNYVQDGFTASGRKYKWVAPDTIDNTLVRRGRYEPVIKAITPKKQQMFVFGGRYHFSEKTEVGLELALTNNDVNTYSSLDSENNVGYGLKFDLSNSSPLNKGKEKGWNLQSGVFVEMIDKNFRRVERYRNVEFERDWNQNLEVFNNELLGNVRTGIKHPEKGELNIGLNTFLSGDDFSGYKNDVHSDLRLGGLSIRGRGSVLSSSGINETEFIRHKFDVNQQFRYFTIGYRDEHERNLFYTDATRDTLRSNSYQFYDWEFYVANNDTMNSKYRIFYRQRLEWNERLNALAGSTKAEEYGLSFELFNTSNSQLRGRTAYRKLSIVDEELTNQEPDNSLVNRLEYNIKLWKGLITSSTFYEVGSGLELKREYIYVEVPAGQGVYVWIDYNGNGIKELNEFEVAQFQYEANYIRVFTPTDEYVRTYTNQFNQAMNIRPSAIWGKKKGVKKFVSRFSNQFSYRNDRRTTRQNIETAFNPFINDLPDSVLLSLNSSLRNTLFFNRSNPKFGADYTFQNFNNRSLLSSGFESRENLTHELRMRWNLTGKIMLSLKAEEGERNSQSDFITGRDFKIDYYSIKPEFSYQPNTSFRALLHIDLKDKQNSTDLGGERALLRNIGTEIRFNSLDKGSFMFNFNLVNISYNGLPNTSLAFEMLEGLNNGQNYTWGINYQQNISKNMQLTLTYNGRKSEDIRAIHNGGVQVRAFF
jgi:hypothetical protein